MASTMLSPFSSLPTNLRKSMNVAALGETIADILGRIQPLMTTTSVTGQSLTKLHELLTKIHSAVQSASYIGEVPKWLRQLKALVNDLNDLMEELSADASSQVRTARVSSIFKPNFIRNRHKIIDRKISTVTQDLQDVAKDLLSEPAVAIKEEKKLAIMKDEMDELECVGRENEKQEIIYKLNLFGNKQNRETNLPVPVVTIVGFAGIGKTKLAKLVYEDEEVARCGRKWIHVKFDVESIAKQVPDKAMTDGQRYLLVLDDVRIEIGDQNLLELQQKLMGSGAAILITTPSNFVANKIAASLDTVKPYVLHGLNDEESRSLFQQNCGQGSISSDVEGEIVRDCVGVPLWIITAARILKNQVSPRVVKAQVAELKAKALKLYYYDPLPMCQKLCFAYCSLFPRDHLFDAEKLTHLWMAEGFVNVRSGTNDSVEPEEICRRYFSDFPEIQDVKEDECGVIKSFKIHPLMHDLACFVTDEEENITVDPDGTKVQGTVLRALFDFSLDIPFEIPDSLFDKAKKLRSILLLTETQSQFSQELKVSTSTCEKIFKSFERLRILDLHDLGIKKVPTSIGELNNLRYLDLSINNIERLPGSITKLSKLQTLKLSHCHHLKELPKDLADLISLRHLVIEGCLGLTHMPRKIYMLSSLHSLSLFVISKDFHAAGLAELASLNNLRGHLQILHLERLEIPAEQEKEYLKGKEHLQQLTLSWNLGDDHQKSLDCLEPHPNLQVLFVSGYKGPTLSNWLTSIESLVKLSLYDCSECKFLGPLDQLPKLKILELRRLGKLEYIVQDYSDESVEFFPFLEELTISYCPQLRSWWDTRTSSEIPSFACISKLHVHECPKLSSMPLYPRIDKELVLVNSSLDPLKNTISFGTNIEKDIIPFSKLKSMQIAGVEKHYAPEEWLIKTFVSLENLHIRACSRLERLPEGFRHLSSLQQLIIENCPKLDFSKSSTEWEGLKKLRSLTIREIPKLESLPSGGDKVISLKELELHNCTELKSLPESIGNLTSLERLVLSECRKLASLPKGMAKLKHLQTLIILDCDLLLPRCQPETGDDWPQIAHVGIDNIQVKDTYQDF